MKCDICNGKRTVQQVYDDDSYIKSVCDIHRNELIKLLKEPERECEQKQ